MLSQILLVALVQLITGADNGLVVAEKGSHLATQRQRQIAFVWGFVGAAVMRFGVLFLGDLIVGNSWIILLGGAYLIYLALSGLEVSSTTAGPAVPATRTHRFWKWKLVAWFMRELQLDSHSQSTINAQANRGNLRSVIMTIWITDFVFSIDNTIAVLAITTSMSVLIPGTLIGMAAIFLAAGSLSTFMAKHPAFARSTYVIVGAIGVQTIARVEVSNLTQLAVVAVILAGALLYEHSSLIKKLCNPPFHLFGTGAKFVTTTIDNLWRFVFNQIKKLARLVRKH